MPETPFDPDDPLCYPELSSEQTAWRTTLHLLATTATTVHIPPGVLIDRVNIQIAAGWTYLPAITEAPDGGTVLTCTVINAHRLAGEQRQLAEVLTWHKGRGPSVPPGGWPPDGTEAETWWNCATCGDTIYPSEHMYRVDPNADRTVFERMNCAVCHVRALLAAQTGGGQP